MEVQITLDEALVTMRRNALSAALRNVNLHRFSSKGSSREVTEYVAERLGVYPGDIRLWLISDGVPECYLDTFLSMLNEHSVWARYQLRPTRKLASWYLGGAHA
ncbi:hypothetical protein ACTWNB_000270 [Vibrio cholerae]|nr:hypothetical protein [Vibrio cholerae]EJL6308137.1 hypothetical protein [Vibrio cholerae]EJL6543940.1 hypothetical protein [Vibrio cholerae]EKB5071651.1 hypothetical protein [Vibrio cholerae]EKF9840878.1 hypothetical protein [Vibrio cholerae]